MDLFGGLPPPASAQPAAETAGSKPATGQASSLFGDLPAPSVSASAPSLFGGLPTPGPSGGGGGKRAVSHSQPSVGLPASKRTAASPAPQPRFTFAAAAAGRRGLRETMEDTHQIILDMATVFSEPRAHFAAYFAVFDGHAGGRASEFAAQSLHRVLAKRFPSGRMLNVDREVKLCLTESFLETDKQFLAKAASSHPVWKDGCTATCCLVVDGVLYSAFLGDSKAVLCRRKPGGAIAAIPLTKDHTPTLYTERKRIQKAGGVVRDGRVQGIMEVSRSIGDGRFKRLGVIAQPDILRCELTAEDPFVVIGCDGLWSQFSADGAAKYVHDALLSMPTLDVADAETAKAQALANQLVNEAIARGSTDNVSALVVLLSPREALKTT